MLIANTPFSRTARLAGQRRWMQARTSGGSADTELMALTVTAKRPAGPSVATTVTPETARPMAWTKRSRATLGAAPFLSSARTGA
jgi:hypothetical protein